MLLPARASGASGRTQASSGPTASSTSTTPLRCETQLLLPHRHCHRPAAPGPPRRQPGQGGRPPRLHGRARYHPLLAVAAGTGDVHGAAARGPRQHCPRRRREQRCRRQRRSPPAARPARSRARTTPADRTYLPGGAGRRNVGGAPSPPGHSWRSLRGPTELETDSLTPRSRTLPRHLPSGASPRRGVARGAGDRAQPRPLDGAARARRGNRDNRDAQAALLRPRRTTADLPKRWPWALAAALARHGRGLTPAHSAGPAPTPDARDASHTLAPAPSVPPSRACSLRHRPANTATPAELSASPASRPVTLRRWIRRRGQAARSSWM